MPNILKISNIILILIFVMSLLSGCGGDLKEENKRLKDEIEKLSKSNSQMGEDLRSQTKKTDELKSSLTALRGEITNLKKEVKELAVAQANLAKANAPTAKQPAPKTTPKAPTKKPQ